MYYLVVPNVDDDDVSLWKFSSLVQAMTYISEIVRDGEFLLTNIVEQSGVIFGYEPEDFEELPWQTSSNPFSSALMPS